MEKSMKREVVVIPFPFSDLSGTKRNLVSKDSHGELHIYNTLGQLQLFQSFRTLEKFFSKEINVEKLSDRIYFLQLKTKDGNINRKVIINH
ncbi:MAG: T9SS type A sorting domain-containing protein [Bacteroidota bacterium]